MIWVFQSIPNPPAVKFTPQGGNPGSKIAKAIETRQRSQMSRAHLSKIAVPGPSDISVPEIEEANMMTSLASFDDGNPLGGVGRPGNGRKPGGLGFTGAESGFDPGGKVTSFGGIPLEMGKRCSPEDRAARLKENGGTPACEDAVMKSLRWLKSVQKSDGSWGDANSPAMTGLVLLAYFGHCETPNSSEFGESCMRGIVYLVDVGMKNNGKLASNFTANGWCYEHAIATYALGEAATFCKDPMVEIPNLMEVTRKAGQFIIDSQNKNGGWAYQYKTDGGHTDSSIVGWQLQALKACSHASIKYQNMKSCINRGLEYLATCQNKNGGFGYNGPGGPAGGGKYFTLTGVGVLCHQMWGKGSSSEVRDGVKYIRENTKFDWNTEDSNLYAHYYESQAMMQSGGAAWDYYNNLFLEQILNNQNPDGTWKPTAHKGHGDNQIYRNCLCTLMLEVYYRFLNTGSERRKGHRI